MGDKGVLYEAWSCWFEPGDMIDWTEDGVSEFWLLL